MSLINYTITKPWCKLRKSKRWIFNVARKELSCNNFVRQATATKQTIILQNEWKKPYALVTQSHSSSDTNWFTCILQYLVVCSCMYSYVTRMYSYVIRMVLVCYSYVTRMLLVCYSYVTRMYSCGVLVTIQRKPHGTWA